ncbi:MAG: endo-1,4-beta-xylanase, partial [Ilumatobacter sp.]|uniref:endo-1,4-beta-xylanase n=1 Tax=Ilumatobacter sp. TaxID=1967498 RepID=UPI003C71DF1B
MSSSVRKIARTITASLVATIVVPVVTPTIASAVEIVYDIDFEDGSFGPWQASGSPDLAVVEVDGDRVLEVSNRTTDFDGIKSPTELMAGVEYTVTMDARLATPGSADMRFVTDPGFTWIGNTSIDGDSWTTVSGTYTPTEATAVYIGSGDHSVEGSSYSFFVDDIEVSSASTAPPGDTEVYAEGFEDGAGGWFAFGGPTVEPTETTANSGSSSLLASGRTQGFEGPAFDFTDVLEPDTDYDLSAWVWVPAAATVGLTLKRTDGVGDNYENVASVDVAADTWTELTGTYSYSDATQLVAYFESATIVDIAIDDVSITRPGSPGGPGPVGVVLATSFDADLGGWVARDAQGTPTLSITPDSFAGAGAAQVGDRVGQGDGIGNDVTEVMPAGSSYEISAWVKMAEGSGPGDIAITMQRTAEGVDAFDTIVQVSGVTSTGWTEITAPYRMPARDAAFMYFETAFPDGTSDDFLVDEVTIEAVAAPVVQDLLPIKDTVDFKVGVATDSRETFGPGGELVQRHFDQMTPENHMKPNAWYDDDRNFAIHPDAEAIMDFAQANDIDVYGHTLVWHQQNPEWFFDRDDGTPLTNSEGDRQVLRDRLRGHIFSVAETLSDQYGSLGSDTNPLTAFDVVNEVISDGVGGDNGLRESTWYEILGEEYIDLAFRYADEAFNTTYAAAGVDRPVMLAINDYNTEQSAKRELYRSLVERLLARGVPVDIVGHQFHVNLAVPISALDDAIGAFSELPITQVVSELDVPTGVPVSEALLIDQGYYFRDAFRLFRDRADELYSVSAWGLTDNRSWLADRGDPLIFDSDYQAKPAYFGIV